MPEDRVRVIVPDTGSAYGGKHTGEHAIEAARLAKAAGKPVKLVWTRAEEFSFGYFRPAGVIDVKAARRRGRPDRRRGSSTTGTPARRRSARRTTSRTSASSSTPRIAAAPGLVPRPRRDRQPLRARDAHGRDRARARRRRRRVPAAASEGRADARRAHATAAQKIGWPRPSAAGRALGIACGTEKGSYVATAAEVVAKRPNGFNVERLVVVFECGAIVNPDGLHNQVEGAVVQGLGGALFEAIEFAQRRR